MIRFVGNDAEGLPLKRKQSQRACERCRKRKKRCVHQPSSKRPGQNTSSTIGESSSHLQDITETVIIPRQHLVRIEQQQHAHSETNPMSRRPQQQLLSPATAESMASAAAGSNATDIDEDDEDTRFVGELNPEGIFVAGTSPAGTATAATASSPEDVVGIWVPRKLINAAKDLPGPILPLLIPYLEGECSHALPKTADYDMLHRLYLEEFHPILPIINLESYSRQQEKAKVLLKLAICLCVSSSQKAAKYLSRSPEAFAAQVTQLLRSAIDNGIVWDKQVVIQLFVVLALTTQLSGDRHASAEFTCRAISYVHTGGIHLDTSMHKNSKPYLAQLFCCVFTLDRLNAAVQGRPVLMHERDFGRDMKACIERQDSLFQLLLRIILLLDKVIALYRPSLRTSDDVVDSTRSFDLTFPAFEDLLSECGTIRAPAALVATVETLYHAVAMLSCRSQSLSETSRNSASHTRQNLSAASITSIAGNEYRGQLSTIPFVPYALSLALRVSYRDLRLSKSSFTRARARRQLLHVCTLLRELGDTFTSSLRLADLAEQTVREMDKAYSNVAGQRKASLAPMLDARQHEVHQHQATSQDQANPGRTSANDPFAPSEVPAVPEAFGMPDKYDMQAFDPGQFDFDLDIFDHFDPGFDIEAIDAALASSIDPSLPMEMVNWDSVGS